MTQDHTPTPPLAFCRVAELGVALGVTGIADRPDCWVHQVDDDWALVVNPHPRSARVTSTPDGSGMVVDLPPYSMAFWWHGWLAGVIDANGGEIAARHDGANEDALIEALEQAIRDAGATPTDVV